MVSARSSGALDLVNVFMADLAEGTGRFNLLQGTTYAGIGVGGALSNVMAGFLLESLGYRGASCGLAAVGLGASRTSPCSWRSRGGSARRCRHRLAERCRGSAPSAPRPSARARRACTPPWNRGPRFQ